MSALRRRAAAASGSANPAAVLSQSAPPGYRQRARLGEDQSANTELRPQTCPILTSQFHWNLNARAVESLSEEELAQVYRLFRFYDSSTIEDTLPSINCRRFLQVLRDGGALATPSVQTKIQGYSESGEGTNLDSGARLDVPTVEKIFAEAVMGKLRTYLDADGQPVLTFYLFCGAIMNCALTIYPIHQSQPEVALMKLLEKLLTSVDLYAEERQREPRTHKSLLQHFPKEGLSALWRPNEAHGAVPPMPSCMESDGNGGNQSASADFRNLKPFRQVLSSFSLDVVRDFKAREQSRQQYTISDDLAASFTPENLSLVIERFKLFDVFDRGTLPRQEILPLLNGLVKKLEILDMYEVLTLLLTGDHFSRYGNASPLPSERISSASSAEIPLTEILKAIHTCRRSRTPLSYSSIGGSHNAAVRKTAGNPTHKLTSNVDSERGDHTSSRTADESNYDDEEEGTLGNLEGSNGRRVSKEVSSKKPSRRSKANGSLAQSLTSSKQTSGGKGSDRKLPPTKKSTSDVRHKQSTLTKEPPLDAVKAMTLSRRTSRRNSKQAMILDGTVVSEEGESTDGGQNDTDAKRDPEETGYHQSLLDEAPVDQYISTPSRADSEYISVTHFELGSAGITVSAQGPANNTSNYDTMVTPKTKVFRVFLLLGGEHDGAVCCTVELTLPQRHVEEIRGIFYLNAPHEILERLQVLPVQPDTESALLMLKKRIQLRLSEGFVLHPQDQLERVDGVLSQICEHKPHYQSPLRASHSSGTFQARLSTPVVSSPHKHGSRECPLGSLDRTRTCVRQGSTSDLLVQLSDSLTNQNLKKKKRALLHSGKNVIASQYGAPKNQDSSQRTPIETTESDLDWIHSVNDANRSRVQLLQASGSTPTVSATGSRKQLRHQHSHKAWKPHQGVQLQPIQ